MAINREDMEHARKVTSVEGFFMHSPFSIVTMVVRIKGDLSPEILKPTIEKIRQKHAMLRARIKIDQNHTYWFTNEEVQEIPIEIFNRKSKDDWIEVHAEAAKIPFDFESRPAIRFILVHSPDESELIILCHHLICDGMSLAFLARDLMEHLGYPERAVETLPAPPAIDLDNLPSDISQSSLVKLLINRMNRQWAADRVFFDQEDYQILTEAYWDNYRHELFPVELSEQETSGLVNRCRQESVTVNSALATAFCGAQSVIQGKKPDQGKIMVAASLRDRIPSPVGEGMGMYAGGVSLKFKFDQKKTVWENARRFHEVFQSNLTNKNLFGDLLNWLYLDPAILEAMNFKKLGHLVPPGSPRYEKLSAFSKREDVVLRILRRDNLDSLETRHWETAVTNLGSLDFPKTYGALELDRLIIQPGGGIPLVNVDLVLGAVTCAGKLSLIIEFVEQAVNRATMEKIKDKALNYLFSSHT